MIPIRPIIVFNENLMSTKEHRKRRKKKLFAPLTALMNSHKSQVQPLCTIYYYTEPCIRCDHTFTNPWIQRTTAFDLFSLISFVSTYFCCSSTIMFVGMKQV